jgi:recombinational DNA repair ATPase RecF
MEIETISLTNFRNYGSLQFSFPESATLLVWKQWQRKNEIILELCLLFIPAKVSGIERGFQDCVKERETFCVFRLVSAAKRLNLCIQKRKQKKVFFGMKSRWGLDFIRDRKIVYFSPEDTTNFLQNLDYRRSIVDRYISYVG